MSHHYIHPTWRHSPRPSFYFLAALLLFIDQASKWWAHHALFSVDSFQLAQRTIVVIPHFFNLRFASNTGIAFSLLSGNNHLLILVTLPILLLVVLAVWKLEPFDWAPLETNVIAAMMVAGAAGNHLDRLLHGYVIDFLDFYSGAYHFPTFNFADSLICVSVAWIIVSGILRDLRKHRQAKPSV